MRHEPRRAAPSPGEIAFRIAMCTGIALFLYFTPDIRADRHARVAARQVDEIAASPLLASDGTECSTKDGSVRLVDAAAGHR